MATKKNEVIQQYTWKCHEFLDFLNVDVSSEQISTNSSMGSGRTSDGGKRVLGFRNSILS